MQKIYFRPEPDGFYGAYYPHPDRTDKVMLIMLGNIDDALAKSAVKWLHSLGCHVMALSPAKNEPHHTYPTIQTLSAVSWLKAKGLKKIGIFGASATGVLAMIAASYLPDIRLTIALTPYDFLENTVHLEHIQGRLVLIGAEDDSLWHTCGYLRLIDQRLNSIPHSCQHKLFLYEHGSHFCFPQSIVESLFPIGSGLVLALAFESLRDFPIESRQTRIDIDRKLSCIIRKW